RAHQDDRQRRVLRAAAHAATELKAVHLGHHEVEQDEIDVRPVALERVERELPVGGGDGLVAMALEDPRHHLADGRAIVHDENSRHFEVPAWPGWTVRSRGRDKHVAAMQTLVRGGTVVLWPDAQHASSALHAPDGALL